MSHTNMDADIEMEMAAEEEQENEPAKSEEDEQSKTEARSVTRRQYYFSWFMSDVLLYLTVLNLAAEWVKSIVVTSFGFSILAALILKLFLDLIMQIEHFFQQKCCVERKRYILGALFMWLVVFGSKFIILWIDDVIFQGWVELGGFINILVLAIVLMLLERLSRAIFAALGKPWTARLDCWAKSEDYTEEALALTSLSKKSSSSSNHRPSNKNDDVGESLPRTSPQQ